MIQLRRARKEKGLNQMMLSEKAGVSQATISLIESGKRINPSLKVVKKLALALGVSIEALTSDDSDHLKGAS